MYKYDQVENHTPHLLYLWAEREWVQKEKKSLDPAVIWFFKQR